MEFENNFHHQDFITLFPCFHNFYVIMSFLIENLIKKYAPLEDIIIYFGSVQFGLVQFGSLQFS